MTQPLLDVQDLHVTFKTRRRMFRRSTEVRAVDGVSFSLQQRETLALVGESGCGKSTTARGVMRLLEPESGSVVLNGEELTKLPRKELRTKRRAAQMVFQDPYSSLDPSMVIGESIGEPLATHFGMKRAERMARAADLLEKVGLEGAYVHRYPYEFSGGQRQRITIARAIAADPSLLVCDEMVSALDVSSQNQILALLADLREAVGLAYLFISHDLSVVRQTADRIAVMYLGRIIEHGPTARVFEAPGHPYTEALLSAVPIPSPTRQRERERIVLHGDPPDPAEVPSGCRFRTRCPYVMGICHEVIPEALPMAGSGEAACHLHTEGPTLAGGSVSQMRVGAA